MMRLALRMVLVFVGVGQVAAAEMPAMTAVPLLDCNGLPCVAATTAGGQRLKLLIDTGDESSVLDAGIAKANHMELSPVTGRDGKVVTAYQNAELKDVRLGGIVLGDLPVMVMDIAGWVRRNQIPAADGTLSYPAFKDRLLEIDYRERVVRVSELLKESVACQGKCGTFGTSRLGRRGRRSSWLRGSR